MKKIIDIFKRREIRLSVVFLIIGLGLGWIFFGQKEQPSTVQKESEGIHGKGEIWTCSMHPQIKEDGPEQCPICGMDLVPLPTSADEDSGPMAVTLSDAAMRMAEIETSVIETKIPVKEVYLPGKVEADERKITQLTAHFPGRIEALYVNYTGQNVNKGQVLAKVYSPELVTAQKELFEAAKLKETNPQFYRAARNKLKLWVLTDGQIDQIVSSGEVQYYYNILSPISGTVTQRNVANGDHIMDGISMFEIVDLRRVWVVFNAYESDIPWVREGNEIVFTIKSLPGKEFSGKVTFIDPVMDPRNRTVRVRTELNNPDQLLKPEMLARGILQSTLEGGQKGLIIPKSAILWTGKKSVVYVKDPSTAKNLFTYREIILGEEAGPYYVVKEGLREGEEVATHGVFKIDGAAQLQGKPSMMNPEEAKVNSTHDHGS